MRERMEPLGDSLLVVGSEELVRVHIHTDRPGDVLTLCLEFGTLSNVTIDNMVEQSSAMAGNEASGRMAVGAVSFPAPHGSASPFGVGTVVPEEVKDTGIVSVATGQGLKDIMTSLGCDLVIDGGRL